MTSLLTTTRWRRDDLAAIAAQHDAALPLVTAATPAVPGHDLWDMWHVARPDGSTVFDGGRSWWFFLATPSLPDPEARHDHAHPPASHDAGEWQDHGWTFAEGFTPGQPRMVGFVRLGRRRRADDVFHRHRPSRRGSCRSSSACSRCAPRLRGRRWTPSFGDWSVPVELVAADGRHYAVAADRTIPAQGIKGFRDPGHFRDPADGADLLFTANAGTGDDWPNGVIGLAVREGGGWAIRPPLVAAPGVNSELERAHMVVHAGRDHLFVASTPPLRPRCRRRRPGLRHGGGADRRPVRPVNGTGLVAANPAEYDAGLLLVGVMQELEVASFVNYWRGGPATEPATPGASRILRRTVLRLAIDGDRVTIA
ncbi:glycoside hydrolase family 68 protein [Sphingomonas sp. MMS24-JH45]